MLNKLQAFLDLFKKGKEVANPAAWKNGTIGVNVVAGTLGAVVVVVGSFGYDLNLSQEVVDQAAAGIIGFFGIANAVMHVITSAKVGVSSNS
jgi:hypothetical protein